MQNRMQLEKIIKLIYINKEMYRGTPYLNKQIRRREQQRSMEYHISNLTQIRPRTGTIQYGNEVHINNRKGQLQKQARFTQIERENRILLEKISSIMGKNSRKASSQQKINRSLNSQLRKRQLQNIQVQNAKLLKRLQQRKPNYETQKFKESWRKQKYVIKNMSNYPFIINDGRRKRSSVSHIANKDINPNTIELCRMRTIDGVSFLITIRLNQQRMQIIGDTKDKREIKVIEIQRGEAIQFIEEECQGKIEKIFDCLRYDKADEVLYLVANEVDIEDVKNQTTMRIKKNTKRDQNPQFDFSEDIPIRVNNQENKNTQRREKKEEQEQIQKPKLNSKQLKKSRQAPKQQNKKVSEIKKQTIKEPIKKQKQQQIKQKSKEIKKQEVKKNEQVGSKKSNKIESSVNTYTKIKKMTEQEEDQKVKSQKPLQKQVVPEISLKEEAKEKKKTQKQISEIKSEKVSEKVQNKKATQNIEQAEEKIEQKAISEKKEANQQNKVNTEHVENQIQDENNNFQEEAANEELEEGVQQGSEQQYQEEALEENVKPLENVEEMLVDHFIPDQEVVEDK